MKKEIRVIGIDDAPFDKFKKSDVLVVGTIFRGGSWCDGVLSTSIRVDGNNSTKKIIEMINKCKFKPQLQCIFLDGIAMGGFNIIDVKKLNKETKLPVIVIIRKMPDFNKIKKILVKLKKEGKFKLPEKAGKVYNVGKIYIQVSGIDLKEAKEILNIVCTRSLIPEAIRVAHLIAAGIVIGESKGNA